MSLSKMAKVVFTQLNEPMIDIKVKDKAKFSEITKRLMGQPLAIYLMIHCFLHQLCSNS